MDVNSSFFFFSLCGPDPGFFLHGVALGRVTSLASNLSTELH